MILYLIDKIESVSLYDHERGKNKFLFYNKKKNKNKVEMGQFGDKKTKTKHAKLDYFKNSHA